LFTIPLQVKVIPSKQKIVSMVEISRVHIPKQYQWKQQFYAPNKIAFTCSGILNKRALEVQQEYINISGETKSVIVPMNEDSLLC
jgi:hypothetical protein